MPFPALSQQLSGTLQLADHPKEVLLLETIGGDHLVVDAATVDASGKFKIDHKHLPVGFYQLAINDTDRVDIILDPEEQVLLHFSGRPLQEHITIERSLENQRMWEYKMVSRQSQKELVPLRQQRKMIDPDDHRALQRLDSMEEAIRAKQQQALQRLIHQDTTSFFSQIVQADRELSAAIPLGHIAIKNNFDWSSERLLRSSVFTKAVMAWMQTAPPELPYELISASDSLFKWTAGSERAWSYTRSLLIRLFHQYGPDHAFNYIIDRYVAGSDAVVPPDDVLLAMLEEQLKVAVGAQAPDVLLPDPIGKDTFLLYDMLQENKFSVLFFYSSTCDHCHEQVPGLKDLYEKWQDDGLTVIGIALDGDQLEFQQMLHELEIPWRSFSELIGWGSPAAKAFQVKATPTFYLLDKRGTIVSKPYDHQELQYDLERVIGQ